MIKDLMGRNISMVLNEMMMRTPDENNENIERGSLWI
jgi:hypothetical protein